jgi:hypothetical protein
MSLYGGSFLDPGLGNPPTREEIDQIGSRLAVARGHLMAAGQQMVGQAQSHLTRAQIPLVHASDAIQESIYQHLGDAGSVIAGSVGEAQQAAQQYAQAARAQLQPTVDALMPTPRPRRKRRRTQTPDANVAEDSTSVAAPASLSAVDGSLSMPTGTPAASPLVPPGGSTDATAPPPANALAEAYKGLPGAQGSFLPPLGGTTIPPPPDNTEALLPKPTGGASYVPIPGVPTNIAQALYVPGDGKNPPTYIIPGIGAVHSLTGPCCYTYEVPCSEKADIVSPGGWPCYNVAQLPCAPPGASTAPFLPGGLCTTPLSKGSGGGETPMTKGPGGGVMPMPQGPGGGVMPMPQGPGGGVMPMPGQGQLQPVFVPIIKGPGGVMIPIPGGPGGVPVFQGPGGGLMATPTAPGGALMATPQGPGGGLYTLPGGGSGTLTTTPSSPPPPPPPAPTCPPPIVQVSCPSPPPPPQQQEEQGTQQKKPPQEPKPKTCADYTVKQEVLSTCCQLSIPWLSLWYPGYVQAMRASMRTDYEILLAARSLGLCSSQLPQLPACTMPWLQLYYPHFVAAGQEQGKSDDEILVDAASLGLCTLPSAQAAEELGTQGVDIVGPGDVSPTAAVAVGA